MTFRPTDNSGRACVLAPDGTLTMRRSFVDTACMCMARAGLILTHGPARPGIAAVAGTSAHAAFERGCYAVRDEQRQASADELQTVALDALDRGLQSNLLFPPGEDPARTVGEARDALAATVGTFATRVQPTLAPRLIEPRMPFAVEDARVVVSVTLDLVEHGEIIGDFKTGRRTNQEAADRSRQMTCQAIAYHAHEGRPPAGLGLRAINDCGTEFYRTSRTAAHMAAYLDVVRMVAASIRAGAFPPCDPGAWWCSPRWCGFHTAQGGPCKHGG